MRRKTPALAVLLAILCALTISTGTASAAGSCTDSWGSDGHPGPWYVGSNQSLHGNTLVITCPSGGTSWTVDYQVCKGTFNGGCAFTPINEKRSGTGSASFSISTNPIGCNVGWNYFTHVHNTVTGGDIYKPADMANVIC